MQKKAIRPNAPFSQIFSISRSLLFVGYFVAFSITTFKIFRLPRKFLQNLQISLKVFEIQRFLACRAVFKKTAHKNNLLCFLTNQHFLSQIYDLSRNTKTKDKIQSILSTLKKASWGKFTLPMAFIRFLPSFCFSSNFRLRVMSPP